MRRAGIALGVLGLVLLGGAVVHAQPDSVRAALLEERGFSPDHSPRGALWRAAAVPGWGQFYNRQFYKVPLVYAGLAGGGYVIYEMNRRYLLFRHANLYAIGRSRENNPYEKFRSDYDQAIARLGGESTGGNVSGRQLRRLRDKYRRWRDLSIVGTGLFYVLTILDAYVSAHLLTFDVGEDLALDLRPTGGEPLLAYDSAAPEANAESPISLSPNGIGVRVRLRF